MLSERLCRNPSSQATRLCALLPWGDTGTVLCCWEAFLGAQPERCLLAFLECCGEKLFSQFCFLDVWKAHGSCTWDSGVASARWGWSFGGAKPD